jgi:hypothetical protein
VSIFILGDLKVMFCYVRSRIERHKSKKSKKMIQYDLFKPIPDDIQVCQIEVKAVRTSLDKVRRGTYASINELKKENYDLKCRLEILERNICNGKVDFTL